MSNASGKLAGTATEYNMFRMKTSPEDITVLLVGGGSIISPDVLAGVGEIIRPPYFGVANAVGAAMAKGKDHMTI